MGKNKKPKKRAGTGGGSNASNVFRISNGRVERLHQTDPMGASWRSYPKSAVRQSVIDRVKAKPEAERTGDDWWQLGEYQVIDGLASGD